MKEGKGIQLILGLVLAIAGFLLLDRYPVVGLLLMMGGAGLLILLSFRVMRISGKVKDNYFDRARVCNGKFAPAPEQVPENIWDKLTEKKEGDK